jgi:DNA-binding CsgD family transcriptional regulator
MRAGVEFLRIDSSKRHDFDPSALTAQELAVAHLVAAETSNRHVAAELFVSIKTVQFHLTPSTRRCTSAPGPS